MRVSPLLAGLFGFGTLAMSACPVDDGCRNYTDCRAGEICDTSTSTCAPDPRRSSGENGTVTVEPPAGDGGSPAPEPLTLRTDFAVPFLGADPQGGPYVLYADTVRDGELFTRERLQRVRQDTGATAGTFVDFANTTSSFCDVEAVWQLTETPQTETWASCKTGPGLRIFYATDFNQPSVDLPSLRADLLLLTGPPFANDYRRAMIAARGGTRFWALQLRSTDGPQTGHFSDDSDLSFGAIGGLFLADRATYPNDFVLVFDRSWPGIAPAGPALVLVERPAQAEAWQLAITAPLALPTGTQAVFLLRPPRTDGQEPSGGTAANVVTLSPQTGLAQFFVFETGAEVLPATQFETDARLLGPPPAATERVLGALSPSGAHLFYTLPSGGRVWRIPTRPGADNEVRFVDVVDANWRPTGLVPVSDDDVWIGYDNENLIERLSF